MKKLTAVLGILALAASLSYASQAGGVNISSIRGRIRIEIPGQAEPVIVSSVEELQAALTARGLGADALSSAIITVERGSVSLEAGGNQISMGRGASLEVAVDASTGQSTIAAAPASRGAITVRVESARQEVTLTAGDKITVSPSRDPETGQPATSIEVVSGEVDVVNIDTGVSTRVSQGEQVIVEVTPPAPVTVEIIPEPEAPEEQVEASPYKP